MDAERDHRDQVRKLNEAAWERSQADPEGSLRLAEVALDAARAHNDAPGAAYAKLNAGWALINLGRYEAAVGPLVEARDSYRELSDDAGLLKALNALAVLAVRVGEAEEAERAFRETLEIAERTGITERVVAALSNLGEVLMERERPDEALALYERALAAAADGVDSMIVPVLHVNRGRALLAMDRRDEARSALERGLSLARAAGERLCESEAMTCLGLITDDERLHRESIALAEGIGHPPGAIVALEHLSSYLIRHDRLDEAEETIERAVATALRHEVRITSLPHLTRLADAYEAKGMQGEALRVLRSALANEQRRSGEEGARRIRALRARHDLEAARVESELVRLRNGELREKTEALELSNRTLRLIHRIGTELTASLELDAMLQLLHDRVNELMQADVFGIAIHREEEAMLEFALVIEDGQQLTPFSAEITSDESFGAWAVRNRRELWMNDADREYRTYVSRRSPFTSRRCRSIIYLPLELRGRVVGVLTVQAHRKRVFDGGQMDLLRLLSPYVAIALDNALKVRTISELNRALGLEKAQLEEANRRIAHLANHDLLTGLPNRRLLHELLLKHIAIARRQAQKFGLLYVDLDEFKPINDAYGHEAGDHVLAAIAGRLRSVVRESDSVARVGGDEFVVIVGEVDGREAVAGVAEKLLEAVRAPIRLPNAECRVAASIGASLFPDDGESYDELIVAADHEMYAAKQHGRSAGSHAQSAGRVRSSFQSIESPSNSNLPST